MAALDRRFASYALATATLLAFAPLARAQETPADHSVEDGDTLWDIAARYLADPFRWPEIFELNADVVEDPHWIFPGENLRLPGGRRAEGVAPVAPAAPVTPVAQAEGAAPTGAGAPEAEVAPRASLGTSLFSRKRKDFPTLGGFEVGALEELPVVSRSDFYRNGFVVDAARYRSAGRALRIIEENPLDLKLPAGVRPYDRIVVGLGGASAAPGDVFQAIRWVRSLGADGDVALSMGLITIDDVMGDSARATVTEVYSDFRIGDPIIPAEPYEVVGGVRPEADPDGLTGRVLDFEVHQPLLGIGDAVFLSVGAGDGVRVGDEFALFSATEPSARAARLEDRLSVVRVTRVTPRTATALVVGVQDPGARPGAPVRRIRRMPS